MTRKLSGVDPEQIVTADQQRELAELGRAGDGVLAGVEDWAREARAALAALEERLLPLQLPEEEYLLVIGLVGARRIWDTARQMEEAAETLHTLMPRPTAEG